MRHLWTSNNKKILKFDIHVYITFLRLHNTSPQARWLKIIYIYSGASEGAPVSFLSLASGGCWQFLAIMTTDASLQSLHVITWCLPWVPVFLCVSVSDHYILLRMPVMTFRIQLTQYNFLLINVIFRDSFSK